MIKIAIVFPVFNGLSFTIECLKNLELATGSVDNDIQYKIILVDDGSSDGSAEWVKEHYKEVIVLTGDGNLWWSGGMNMGMAYAFNELKVDYLVCWNNDIVAESDYFRKLATKLEQYGNGVLLCSKVYFSNPPDKIFAFGCFYNSKTGLIRINNHGLIEGNFVSNGDLNVDWAGGMGTIIPLCVYKAIGGFDAVNFPQYKGDADYCLRAKSAGFKLIACDDLKIWNSADNTGLSIQKDNLYYLLTSVRSHFKFTIFMRFVLRHGQPMAWLLAPFITYTRLCLSIVKRRIK